MSHQRVAAWRSILGGMTLSFVMIVMRCALFHCFEFLEAKHSFFMLLSAFLVRLKSKNPSAIGYLEDLTGYNIRRLAHAKVQGIKNAPRATIPRCIF